MSFQWYLALLLNEAEKDMKNSADQGGVIHRGRPRSAEFFISYKSRIQ